MKNYKQMLAIAILLAGAGMVYFFGTRNVNTNLTIASAQTKSTIETDKDFPVAILDTSGKSKTVDEKRQKKNSRFEGSKWVDKTINDTDYEASLITHWQIGLPSLPTKKSAAVITATVKSAMAFLCNDNGSIYSEFSLKPDYIIKDNKSSPIKINEEFTVDRMGGNVQYPSGKVVKYKIYGQGMPRVGGRYVFFLSYDEVRDMYLIITAYEILDGKVTALDGKGASKGSGFDFIEYNGTSEYEFLNQVRDAGNLLTESKEERLP